MSKPVSIGQSHNVMSILANNVDWDALDSDVLQQVVNKPRESGVQFTAFLRNGGRVIVGEPKVLQTDRSKPFGPVGFLGEEWTIEEQDERSLTLTELDLTKVRFEDMLKDGESWIKGEEKLKRLKEAGHIRLDAVIFLHLWKNQHLIPESWKEKINGNPRYIFFDGTILRSPSGDRYVLYLIWRGGGWDWGYYWLDRDWSAYDPSAILAP